jgi:hypothetical protein
MPRRVRRQAKASSIVGISHLVNPEHVRLGADLHGAEETVTGRTAAAVPEDAVADGGEAVAAARQKRREVAAEREFRGLLEELDIDELDGKGSVASAGGSVGRAEQRSGLGVRGISAAGRGLRGRRNGRRAPPMPPPSSSDESSEESDESSEDSSDGGAARGARSSRSSGSSRGSDSSRSSGSSRNSGSSGSSRGSRYSTSKVIGGLSRELGVDFGRRRRSRVYQVDDYGGGRQHHRDERYGTDEHVRRRQVSDVLHGMRGDGHTGVGAAHGNEALRLEDQKTLKLEEIAALRQILQEDRVDVSGIPRPTGTSSIDEVDATLRSLRLKNDRNRYTSLGEELMMGAAEGIESTFDGSREIPLVGWRPDYTGYRNTVQTKLTRMRFETGQIVGGIVQEYNMGPMGRILLELLPSLVLYPSQNRRAVATPGLYDSYAAADGGGDDRMRSKIGEIRSAETPVMTTNPANDLGLASAL